jgi:hypothetical protein
VANPGTPNSADFKTMLDVYLREKGRKLDRDSFGSYLMNVRIPLSTLSWGLRTFVSDQTKLSEKTFDIIRVAMNILAAELRREFQISLLGIAGCVLLLPLTWLLSQSASGLPLIILTCLPVAMVACASAVISRCSRRRKEIRQCVIRLVLEAREVDRAHANIGKILVGTAMDLVALGLITHMGYGTSLLVSGTKLAARAITLV